MGVAVANSVVTSVVVGPLDTVSLAVDGRDVDEEFSCGATS